MIMYHSMLLLHMFIPIIVFNFHIVGSLPVMHAIAATVITIYAYHRQTQHCHHHLDDQWGCACHGGENLSVMIFVVVAPQVFVEEDDITMIAG